MNEIAEKDVINIKHDLWNWWKGGYFIAPSPNGRNMDLSLRAKGLMYVFFKLPPEWDYSFAGLVAIVKEGKCAVRTVINELKEAGYIDVELNRDSKGLFKYKLQGS